MVFEHQRDGRTHWEAGLPPCISPVPMATVSFLMPLPCWRRLLLSHLLRKGSTQLGGGGAGAGSGDPKEGWGRGGLGGRSVIGLEQTQS